MPGKVLLPAMIIDRAGLYNSDDYFRTTTITRLRPVQHYEIELFTQDGGSAVIDNVDYPIRANTVLFCRPGMQRFSVLPLRCYFLWLDIQADEGGEWLAADFASLPPMLAVTSPARYVALFEAIRHSISRPGQEMLLQARVGELLNCLYQEIHRNEAAAGRQNAPAQAVLATAHYIDEHYCQPINLDDLAAGVHLSPNYLHRLFSRGMGQTPYQYILNRRLDAARELLANSDFSLAEIAERCAFASQTYFSFVFRRETGQTPSQYRHGQE